MISHTKLSVPKLLLKSFTRTHNINSTHMSNLFTNERRETQRDMTALNLMFTREYFLSDSFANVEETHLNNDKHMLSKTRSDYTFEIRIEGI